MGLPSPLPLTVEINPTGSSWVDITSYVRDADGVDIETGRANEADSIGPTLCRLRVDNRDGRFSRHNPNGTWYPDLGLGTPLRAYWSSTANMRFSGEIVELPTRWNQGAYDSTAPLVAASPLRRMQQGASALRSPLFRSLSAHANVVAYWPCEDNAGATSAASPIVGVSPWRMPAEYGSTDGPAGSDQLPLSPLGSSGAAARVPNHTSGDVYVVQQAWRIDEDQSAARHMLHVFTTSTTLAHWLVYMDDTNFGVRAWDVDEVLVVDDTEALDHDLFGQWLRIELRFWTNGSSVSYDTSITTADSTATVLNSITGSRASSTKGRVTRVGSDGGTSSQDRYFGHLTVLTGTATELPLSSSMEPLTSEDRHAPFHGFTGELAADRFERLCGEEDLTCTIIAPTGGLELPGVAGSTASTPDVAALDITGDIEIRAWLSATDWASGVARELASKYESTADQRSWAFWIDVGGQLGFTWSTAGTLATVLSASTPNPLAPLPPDDGPLAVAVTLDVNNGAGGHVVTFYAHPDIDAPLADWTQVYTETTAGTTSIFSGSANLIVGNDEIESVLAGLIREVRVYNGIGGTLVASPDFTAQIIGATGFTDSAGRVWTINGDAAIVRADDTMPMGPQRIDTIIANLQDCANTDRGRFYEDPNGLVLRTISNLYNQAATMAIASTDLAFPPEPTDDDLQTINDVTVSRPTGGSARYTNAAHVADHGRWDTSVEANVSIDDWLQHIAAWLVHLGTVDEMRWPRIDLKLHGKPGLINTWLAVALGDRLTISHDLTQLPGVDIDLLVEGWAEHIDQTEWNVTLNCVPASPYDVAVFDTARFDADDSVTSGSFVAGTGTSLTVVSAGRLWVNSTDHASEFPFHIKVSGVVLNVTAISGATSPQTFTVTQTPVNGVTKTIASGSSVALADTPVFAL